MSDFEFILLEAPAPGVRRITLNRPEKRNAMNNGLRSELFRALETHDRDREVHCTILRGAIGYPVVRVISPPDMQFHPWLVGMRRAMELMLTGDAIDGREAAAIGFANRAYPEPELDERVLEIAERIAKVPPDLQQLNKRSVHRAMEIMGVRAAMRAGSELQALATHQESVKAVIENALASVKTAGGGEHA